MTRNVFYSFHYKLDVHRVARVRNIGALEANKPASDNDWETIKSRKDTAIKNWISDQLNWRTCTVVLVGAETAQRKWIQYEIRESWKRRKGVVGIHIHGLKDLDGYTSEKGDNPFDNINLAGDIKLSSVVPCHNPPGNNSKERYEWIANHLETAVEEAIETRQNRMPKSGHFIQC